MDGVRRNPGNRPKYDIDDEGVMVLYEACKQYKKLLSEDTTQTPTKTNQTNQTLSTEEMKMMKIIRIEPNISQKKLSEKLNWTLANVKYYSLKLQKKGIIKRVGTNRKGYWEVANDD